ncbi:Lsr2 family protein [Rhodococcus sp. USK10]|uniref:ERCC4-type nuclease n=1 Tax=Rhodococcus wratislaviensis TaxID=44752 RepID=A0A402C5Y5_RHOWR|nr:MULTISPECIES: histone-like nucleoid-structuring protein Lsr2 [Rhodococcus]QYB07372.1 Lsr2 family protein [Rhodococcus sp. USK10]GCE38993.1 ERCC4-type nuclease [Rhodococcus wratislaviensis]
MPDDLLIARNPEAGSTLPYLVRVPLGPGGIVVKAKQPWPRESKVYCHRADEWPADAEILERLEVRSCTRRGPAIDLVLTRARENRSQLVMTRARGREMIFWQSPRTAKQARPAVTVPTARAHGRVLDIVVDTAEKYPYTFGKQQATTVRRRLSAGDYAVEIGDELVAVVERKTLEDLAASLLSGRMTYAAAELSALPRAAVVVEDRYSRLFKLEHVSGARVAEALAELQARFPALPVTFCETRQLGQEWTYRWLGACLHEWESARATSELETTFATAPPVAPAKVDVQRPAVVRAWARTQGIEVSEKGRIPAAVMRAFSAAHAD